MNSHHAQWTQQLQTGCAELALPLSSTQQQQLLAYLALLERWNRRFNLTAVRDPAALVPRHLLDSLAILPWVGSGPLLDIGTGAGLPGIPLAILRPDLPCTLLDTNGKKTRFVRQVTLELGLTNVNVLQQRVEQLPTPPGFAQITARAVTALTQLVNLSAPLLVEGGILLAMKGSLPEQELAQLAQRGGEITIHPLVVPQLIGERHLICWRAEGES